MGRDPDDVLRERGGVALDEILASATPAPPAARNGKAVQGGAAPSTPEAAIIGAALASAEHFTVAQGEGLTPGDFADTALGAAWRVLTERRDAGRPVDAIMLSAELGRPLAVPFDAAPPDLVREHARLVRRASIQRQREQAVHDLAQRPHDRGLVERLAELHRQEAAIGQGRRRLFDPASFDVSALAALAESIPPKLPFGLAPLDEALDGGFPSGGMVILGAPPKHHKTAWLIDCAMGWAAQGERVVYVSSELTRKEALARCSSHAQFGHSNKWHSRIKYEPERAAENLAPIRWLAGRLEVVSLLDEEARPDGLRWPALLDALAELDPPPLLIADYVEELALRAPAERGATETDRNKATLIALRDFAVRRRARVLAVCSVPKASYGGSKEAVFNRHDASPEEFVSVVKHTGFGEYAASAILALQLPPDVSNAAINDPTTGFRCLPMRLHLAMAREGHGPVTVPVLSFAGYCRFALDSRTDEAKVNPLHALIEKEMAKPINRLGKSGREIAGQINKREKAVHAALREMLALETIWASDTPGPRKRVLWRHLMYVSAQLEEQQTLAVEGAQSEDGQNQAQSEDGQNQAQ